jgi:integrase
MEEKIEQGEADTLGLPQFQKVRTDLHFIFNAMRSFSPDYENRANPFAELDFTEQTPRVKVTIESIHFAAISRACSRFVEEGLCTEWITQMFLTSLLSGLREGETMALCRDQLDLKNGVILVDRALRRSSRALDPKTRREVGPVRRQAMHLPKGGSTSNPRHRVVLMSDQLKEVLRPIHAKSGVQGGEWNLIWPSEAGGLKEQSRFRKAWSTLCKRLEEVAQYAATDHEDNWQDVPTRRD